MLNRFFTILTLIALCSCTAGRKNHSSAAPNTLTDKERAQGWELLFDGTTKNGWHVFNNRTDGAAWKVEDGVLFLDPQAKGPNGENGGDLTSDKSYTNFHLKVDWKINTAGNSGIMFHAQEDPKYRWAYVTAPEMQIIDNNAHPDAKNIKHRAGDLYDLISAVPENNRPPLEWNTSEIIYQNGNLSLYQNGKEVVVTKMNSPEWKELIAKSKFKSMAEFAQVNTGKLVLQDHGDKVWFRNIKVRPL